MGQGKVQCSKCNTLFDAISTLSEIAFENHDTQFRQVPTLPFEQALTPLVAREPEEQTEIAVIPTIDSHSSSSSTRIGWLLGCTVMIVLLITQITFLEGNHLVQKPSLRPWFEDYCALIKCELPAYQDPSEIDVLEQSLHPLGSEAFEFRLVMVNASQFQQAFPRLRLSLVKFNGDPMAQRVFFPREYFPNENHPTRMSIGKPFEIRLKLVNPNDKVGGYHFNLI